MELLLPKYYMFFINFKVESRQYKKVQELSKILHLNSVIRLAQTPSFNGDYYYHLYKSYIDKRRILTNLYKSFEISHSTN